MPKEPKVQMRPADVIGTCVATCAEHEDLQADGGKNKAAQSLGQLGGWARAKALSARRRKEIAQKAAATRWKS
jgi:hypothetical protein